MKIASIVFASPVKVLGDMCKSLNASVEVGRLGTRKHVSIELGDGFVEISVAGSLVRVVPLSNVVDFLPIVEPVVEKVPGAKK
jgi:hypothetical protein